MKISWIQAFLVTLAFSANALEAKYKIKDLQLRAADQYESHQDFQGLVIGAYPCDTLERTLEVFDTEKLHEKGILPVVLVIENNNEFPVQILGEEIYLVAPDQSRSPSLPYVDVLLEITLRRPLSSQTSRREVLLQRSVPKDMFLDFQHKDLGSRLIAPQSSDYGVVFFRMPENSDLQGHYLYIPQIFNFISGEPLIFFEFELKGSAP